MFRRVIAKTIAIGMLFTAFSACHARAAEMTCPGEQGFPFDGTRIAFDSFPGRSPKGQLSVVNCVVIAKAAHEYRIDWSEAGIDAYTDKGLQVSSRYLGDDPKMDGSTAYVGVNRTKFTPGLLTEKTLLVKIKEAFESHFLGSVSTVSRDQPEAARQTRLQPVDLEFEAELTEPGRAHLEFVNHAGANSNGIGFSLPEDVRKTLPDPGTRFRFSGERGSIDYSTGPGDPVAIRVIVTLLNSDYQEIGSIPVTIIVGSSKQ
jgi:hypothetical protein